MKRALALALFLLATAASATELAPATHHARETSSPKPQWAPSGNFRALHARAVFDGETRSSSGSYARESRETAAAKSVWSYANLGPTRYVDPDGREGQYDLMRGCVQGFFTDLGANSPYDQFGLGAQPQDADVRLGFNGCRPSVLLGPVAGAVHDTIHDSERALATRWPHARR